MKSDNWERELRSGLDEDWLVRVFESVSSTMDAGRELCAQRPLAEGRGFGLVLARQQSSGRGRQGRIWQSPKRGLFATYVFATRVPLSELSSFALVCGVALRRVFSRLGLELQLKWPNDVVSRDGRKLAGILLETQQGASAKGVPLLYLLVGVGVNVQLPTEFLAKAISLHELCTQKPPEIPELAARIGKELQGCFEAFERQGLSAFKEEWSQCSFLTGKQVQIETGSSIEQGRVLGIAADGQLELQTGTGLRALPSGHILEISG
jgi:BirA family biotin operon repressor/biotin-[acetyl-CoA-carboxylase] ligase